MEPPVATETVMALSKAFGVKMSRGRMFLRRRSRTARPARRQISGRLGSTAGTEALPGSDIPSASITVAMVFAV